MSDTTIARALTVDEWRHLPHGVEIPSVTTPPLCIRTEALQQGGQGVELTRGDYRWTIGVIGDEARALAAILLAGQPFGFTWEMVDALTEAFDQWLTDVHDDAASVDSTPSSDPDYRRTYAACRAALANLAALLPPRE